jgi:O-antigen/teichoic acid export membrane protein
MNYFKLGQFFGLVMGAVVLGMLFSFGVILTIINRVQHKRRPWWKFWKPKKLEG